jgi:subtilisin family serine protease
MFKRVLFFLLLAGTGFAQPSVKPIVRSAVDSTVRSIIIKFRTSAAMSDATTLAKLQAVSSTSMVLRPVFTRPTPKFSVQSVSVDTVGLDRILKVPVRDGMTVADAVRSLSGVSAIEYAEPNYQYHIQRGGLDPKSTFATKRGNIYSSMERVLKGEISPNDPDFDLEWWLQSVHAPEAWSITEGDSTIHIGFVDTGVDWLHPDLKFQFAVNPAEDINHDGLFEAWPSDSLGVNARGDTVYGDIDGKDHDGNGYANDVIGYNFVNQEEIGIGDVSTRGPIPYDLHGHGTDMAGILAAQQNNGIGISGIAPKCKLVALRAFDANGTGSDDDIATAIVYAADNHVQILSLSFGDIIPSLLQRDAIRYAISKGVTVFGSSGNDGSTGPNYPSDFDEVVSVGGTAPQGLYIYTTHGEELDVVAPGQDVYTTKLGGGYDSVSGTSASSPIAAGIAALLLSKNPNLTPIQLRSIIESTTTHVGDRIHSANGQVDANAALNYPGTAQIKMVMPHTLDEFHIGDTMKITGDAMSTLFTGYSLSWEKDYQKDSLGYDQFGNYGLIPYDSIVSAEFDTSNAQVLNGTLGTLDTHGFDTGTYTIIFALGSSDNRSTQERCNIYMAKARPKFVSFSIDSIWVNTERGLLIQATTNIPAQLGVKYSVAGANPSVIADDLVGFEHAILIHREQAQAGVPLAIEAMLVTPNGDTTKFDTVGMIPNEAVAQYPQGGFIEKPYTLPPGFALDSVLSIPAGDQVVENPYSSGLLTVFQFDSAKMAFKAIDSVQDPSVPHAIGNSQGDGRPELIVGQISGLDRVYKQNAAHSILGNIVFENDTLSGCTFATLDSPGKQDIVGVIDSEWMAYQYSNGRYSVLGTAIDPSKPDYYNPNNNITWANVKGADLLGTGVQDLVVLDDAANLIIYEREASAPSGFKVVYSNPNSGASAGTLLTVGDFNGDGKPDIAYAYHPIFEQDTLDEYHPAYWTLVVLRNLGNMKFDTMSIDHFYGSNQNDHFYLTSAYGSIGRITNVTGRSVDDLAVTFFPNFYLLEFDSSAKRMKPIWNYPVSQSPRGAISWDFDRNGKREFGFMTGDSIRFFEHSDSYTEQTPAPAGLMVSPRDTNRVDIEWAPVGNATMYYILRAGLHDQNYTLIDSTASTDYTDTTVANGDTLIYSVFACSPSYAIPNSQPAYGIEAVVHPMPRLVSATAESHNIRVRTSQTPRNNRVFAGTIMVDDTIQPDAIAMSSDSALVMSISNLLSIGTHRMRVTSFGLRDIYNSPFDTAHYLAFQVLPDTILPQFYISSWNFDQGPNGLQIHVIFNEQPGASALDVSHYSLSPYGTLTSISADPGNPNAVYIEVQGVKLVALGVPFVLCVTNITSISNTPLDAAAGNCVGISLVEPDLSNVMVYPNPAKQSVGQLTFARLTANADIRIYTIRMKPIREITVSGSEGGAVWDLRDDAGNPVPSGEYLYYVTGSNAAGVAVQGVANKLVVVDDQK